MSETRYETIETYDNNGNLIGAEQIPWEVSDEELEREGAEQTIAELVIKADKDFSISGVARLVKALARLRR